MRPRGKVLKVDVTPYHILDIMADPAYMKHFIKRYNVELEKAKAKGVQRPWWSFYYDGKPELLFDDCVEEIKRILGMQKTSSSATRLVGGPKNAVLSAASDWITEKTGRLPEFEIFPNTVKSARINFDYYGHNKKNKKAREAGTTGTAIDLGHPGASPVREEPSGGDEVDDLLR